MGAWDGTSFGNDTANDWVYELERSDDLSLIDQALTRVMETGEAYLEAPEAEEAIAAAEVVAWLRGRPAEVDAYTKKVAAWVAAHPLEVPQALLEKALAALARIQAEPSELLELWEGQDEWSQSVQALRERLQA